MKTLITIIITFVITIGLAVGVWMFFRSRGQKEKTTEVRIEKAQRGSLTESVNAPGMIKPRRKVEISAKMSARILDLPFDEGGKVTKGDPKKGIAPSVLVRLDGSDLEAVMKSAQAHRAAQAAQIEVEKTRIESQKAGVTKVEITLAQAQRELGRQKKLLKTDDISQAEIDVTQSRVDQLEADLKIAQNNIKVAQMSLLVLQHNLEAAEAEISRARERLSYTTITSPIDGVVTRLNAEVGEVVMTGTMNNPGTVILEVADLSQMLVRAMVDEADVAGVKVGQRANVRIQAWDDTELKGIVDTKAVILLPGSSGTKCAEVEILLENDGQEIYSGLTADVDIEILEHKDILKVPSQAVLGREIDSLPKEIRQDNPLVDMKKMFTTVVYRFIDGKAYVTPVKAGPSDASDTVILEGITEEDIIITGPYKALESLKHEQKVKEEKEDQEDKEVTEQQIEKETE